MHLSREWNEELTDFGRAFGSGLILGIPLIYTMEAWWFGLHLSLWQLALFVLFVFGLNLILSYAVGFKKKSSINSAFWQATYTMAVSFITALVLLVVLARIGLDSNPGNIAGLILLQSIPISIGASLGNAILGKSGESRKGNEQEQQNESPWKVTISNIVSTIVGAVFVGFSIALILEIPKLAAEMTFWHELALAALTLGLVFMLVYLTEYEPAERDSGSSGAVHSLSANACMVYAIVLVFSYVVLVVLGRLTLESPPGWAASQVIVLGLPVAIGGAAGRLVL